MRNMTLAGAAVGLGLLSLLVPWSSASGSSAVMTVDPLPVEYVTTQGLRRAVRLYRPERLAEPPALVLALHGSGGNGERLRRLTGRAFERLADEEGFLLAYPDALGGQWNDCRARAGYHAALAGIDDVGFLRAVAAGAAALAGRELAAVFLVGYSNGGHLVFRAALEAPRDFSAFATIGAHLPTAEERDCTASAAPVSLLMVSGTDDPINPFHGGEVRLPSGGSPGHVLSAEATARYFTRLVGAPESPTVERHPDRDPDDATRVETRHWRGEGGQEVALMIVRGGGHTLPHPTAPFPAEIVGRTSRDLDAAQAIWSFFVDACRRSDGQSALRSMR
jgi:polyhydroxybutyrate depolymerase